jgi:4-hydroxy-3-methylbut-2-enyl diphosphate reductase
VAAEVRIAAPLLVEWLAVRTARRTVVHTGMGRRRSLRARQSLGDVAVLVAGVAGGLAPGVGVGDLVVASEVWSPDGEAVQCRAERLVEHLRDTGFTVHYGPIGSVARFGAPTPDGALAVDMESWWLAPAAVVRAISDTAQAPVYSPAIVRNGLTALRALRRAVPVLDAWSLQDPAQR